MMSFLIVFLLIAALVVWFINTEKFGSLPAKARRERILKSPNYKKSGFENLSHTPQFTGGSNFGTVLSDFLFSSNKKAVPPSLIPSFKTDLMALPADKNTLVWFGHSSYYMQVDGKKILVDPVLSGAASPISFTTPSFKGSDIYKADEIPDIDYLFISHDHWDHLDYDTVKKLEPRVGKVICGLGIGEHLERWGYSADKIAEHDWHEHVTLDDGFEAYTVPARHFSGRGLRPKQGLWMAFAFFTPTYKIYIGGDSGYDYHFAEAGKKYGPFDLVILECGQYNKNWANIHTMPEEVVQAAKDLQAKTLLPVHWAKFKLAMHDWDEPILRLTAEAEKQHMPIVTPLIGEAIDLDKPENPSFGWWKKVK